MDPSRGAAPFDSAAWVFALPTIGYRMLAEFGAGIEDGGVRAHVGRLRSRRGVDATRWFPEVAQALTLLRLTGRTVVDGEICVLDAAGRSDLQRLHERALHPGQHPGASAVVLCMQDVLVWEGCDVRALSWSKRRQLLRQLSLPDHGTLRLQRTVNAEGVWLWRQAQALGCESMHAHRCDTAYMAGPSIGWQSIPVAVRSAA